MLPILSVAAFAPPATGRSWTNIGPKNIGDDVHGRGEAGTIGPAVSKDGVKMYMGGNNNAASSGVLKSIDGGMHWTKVSAGITDTRLLGLFIVDDAADHVLAGTPSGVFETLKQSGKDAELVRRHPASAKFIFGYLAGFLAEFFIYPLDTVRRRQQALGDSTPLNRMNPVRALGKLFAQEGIVGAYKGLSLNLIKNPMGTAVSFAVNDLVKDRPVAVRREPAPLPKVSHQNPIPQQK